MGKSQGSETDSYADSFIREIGFKIGENSLVGSTVSSDQVGNELLHDVDLDIPEEDNSGRDVEPGFACDYGRRSLATSTGRGMTMADAYSAPYHSYFNKTNHDEKFPEKRSPQGIDDAYAITLRNNTSDDVSISTLGEESIKRKAAPLFAQQVHETSRQNAFIKAPVGHQLDQLDSLDLKEANTGSTLEEQPSEELRDEKDKSQHSHSSDVSNAEIPTKRWGLIYFTLGTSLTFLGAASVVIGICMMQLRALHSSDSVQEPAMTNTWAPRRPEDLVLQRDEPEIGDPDFARKDLLQIISTASPSSLSSLSDTSSPQYQVFEWLIQNPDYLEYSIERVLQRWSVAVLYFSLGGASWPTMDAHECLWYSTDVQDICDDNGRIVGLRLANSDLSGSIPPEVSLLSNSLRTYSTKHCDQKVRYFYRSHIHIYVI